MKRKLYIFLETGERTEFLDEELDHRIVNDGDGHMDDMGTEWVPVEAGRVVGVYNEIRRCVGEQEDPKP